MCFGNCFEMNVTDPKQETKNRESFYHIISMTALNTCYRGHICGSKHLGFLKAKHTNGQMLHRSSISSALKYLAPPSYPLKACKFLGTHIPVFPNVSTVEKK